MREQLENSETAAALMPRQRPVIWFNSSNRARNSFRGRNRLVFGGKPLWQRYSGKQRESVSWTAALSNPPALPGGVITSLNETLHDVFKSPRGRRFCSHTQFIPSVGSQSPQSSSCWMSRFQKGLQQFLEKNCSDCRWWTLQRKF